MDESMQGAKYSLHGLPGSLPGMNACRELNIAYMGYLEVYQG
jgi:hypothetical protein